MKLYCGIDLHANNSVVSVTDERDGVHFEKRLPNRTAKRVAVSATLAGKLGRIVMTARVVSGIGTFLGVAT